MKQVSGCCLFLSLRADILRRTTCSKPHFTHHDALFVGKKNKEHEDGETQGSHHVFQGLILEWIFLLEAPNAIIVYPLSSYPHRYDAAISLSSTL